MARKLGKTLADAGLHTPWTNARLIAERDRAICCLR